MSVVRWTMFVTGSALAGKQGLAHLKRRFSVKRPPGPAPKAAVSENRLSVTYAHRRHFTFSLQKLRFFDVNTGGRILR